MIPLALVLACASKPAPRAADISDPDATEQDVDWARESVRFHMSEHYTRAVAARDAVIAGEHDAARQELAWLGEHETFEGVPEAFGPYLNDMRAVASTGAVATDSSGIAACISGLGVTCAGCHEGLGVEPTMPVTDTAPDNTGGINGHKARYGWAADQLWIALAKPSDDAWQRGFLALREPEMDAVALGLGAESAPLVDAYMAAMDAVAMEGSAHEDPEYRAVAYGRVVNLCAECHATVRN